MFTTPLWVSHNTVEYLHIYVQIMRSIVKVTRILSQCLLFGCSLMKVTQSAGDSNKIKPKQAQNTSMWENYVL